MSIPRGAATVFQVSVGNPRETGVYTPLQNTTLGIRQHQGRYCRTSRLMLGNIKAGFE
ncbi:MAG: hypothetical protein LBC68_07480 [Prevotellaceae bacterium]|jgi:hypothetical protein|nr:hypothetical protein [Prevotellaceae bacterium]